MPRLNQSEILLQFFPEIHTTDKPEVMRRVGTMACRLVLLDLLGAYENARAEKGPGVLVIRMVDGKRNADYVSASEFENDLALASRSGDTATATFLADVLSHLGRLSHDSHALFMMVEAQGASCMAVPFETPEQAIEEMLREVAP